VIHGILLGRGRGGIYAFVKEQASPHHGVYEACAEAFTLSTCTDARFFTRIHNWLAPLCVPSELVPHPDPVVSREASGYMPRFRGVAATSSKQCQAYLAGQLVQHESTAVNSGKRVELL
jgi:hypothetical protein